MKRILAAVITVCLLNALLPPLRLYAAEPYPYLALAVSVNPPEVKLYGVPLNVPKPFERDGIVWVPFRAVAEAAGAAVDWDGASRTITAEYNGLHTYKIDEIGAVIVNNTTFVPIGFLRDMIDEYHNRDVSTAIAEDGVSQNDGLASEPAENWEQAYRNFMVSDMNIEGEFPPSEVRLVDLNFDNQPELAVVHNSGGSMGAYMFFYYYDGFGVKSVMTGAGEMADASATDAELRYDVKNKRLFFYYPMSEITGNSRLTHGYLDVIENLDGVPIFNHIIRVSTNYTSGSFTPEAVEAAKTGNEDEVMSSESFVTAEKYEDGGWRTITGTEYIEIRNQFIIHGKEYADYVEQACRIELSSFDIFNKAVINGNAEIIPTEAEMDSLFSQWASSVNAQSPASSEAAARNGGNAMAIYEDFLSGKISANVYSEGEIAETLRVEDILMPDVESKYTLMEKNGDGTPELLVSSGEICVFTVQNGELTLWWSDRFYAGSSQILSNGAVLQTLPLGGPVHVNYMYIVLNENGNEKERVVFSQYDQDLDGIFDDFFFEDEEYISQEEWERKTEPYLSVGEIDWKEYVYSESFVIDSAL